jgi:hypothetical protein
MTTTCEKCDSDKIIPDVQIYDQGQYSDTKLQVAFPGNPQATFFKEWVWGELKADICGECGHVKIKADKPHVLWRRYQKSLENS